MSAFQLDEGDTGEALLKDRPVPVSAQAERLKRSGGSSTPVEVGKVKEESASDVMHRQAQLIKNMDAHDKALILYFLSGHRPETFDLAAKWIGLS